MKNTKLYTLLLTFALVLSSCNEFLDVLPENDQVADEYWQTKEEMESVIAAIYVKYRETVREQFVYGEIRGNSVSFGTIADNSELLMANGYIYPTNPYCKWGKWYSIINLANMVIDYAPLVKDRDPSFTESLMNTYVAEAHYLRGLAYFFLVRNFRDVPIILEPYLNDDQDYEVAKSPEADVWDQIISDLLVAEAGTKSFYSDEDAWMSKGRATKWAVKATLADVYLWTEAYEKAILACNDVINSGRVGLINGYFPETEENNWFTIYSEGNTNEGIFELQWDADQGQTNGSLFSWFGNNPYRYVISQNTLDLFLLTPNDIRGLNATYQLPLGKIWKYIGSTAGNRFNQVEVGATRTGDEQDQNWIMYRMADIILMKAEALVLRGQGEEDYIAATELVNQIRTRAQVLDMAEPLNTELEMLQMVLNEKAKEFVAEGKRWYDLLRFGKRNNYQYLDEMINEVLKNATSSNALILQSSLKNVNSHYLPIHSDELTNNKALVQNPYYEAYN